MLYREIESCRSCHSVNLKSVFDLGIPYISDFIWPDTQEDKAPLDLVICQDCTLVQLRHTVNRDRLYRDYYYRSGTNESMVAALRDVVEDVYRRVLLNTGDSVLDIGANDGTLLRMYPDTIWREGFEPSTIARETQRTGIHVWHQFFPPPWPRPTCRFKAISSIACFYDIDDPNAFVAAIKEWLHPEGVWVCQMQDLHGMMATNGFDNICHEHLVYWSRPAFEQLLHRHDLYIDDIGYNTTNGSSIRYIVKHGSKPLSASDIGAHEYSIQMSTLAHKADRTRKQTLRLLAELTGNGKTVLGYGASTKGNTLLQYYGLTPDLLPAIADRNADKWGRQMVGTHIPIISEELMRAAKPDYLFVLPWHFIDSFLEREQDFLDRGGQFIVPLPNLFTVGGDRCRQFIREEVYARA